MATSLGRRILVNTSALASANLWRIAVSFLIQLLVARRLGLESLGQYTVVMAYLNVSQVLCELGLPLYLVRTLAPRPTWRRALMARALLMQLSVALAIWGGLALLGPYLPYPATTRTAIWLVGASLPFFAVCSAAGTVFQAAERLELLLWQEVAVNLLILAASIMVIQQAGDVADLLLIVVIAQAIGVGVALFLIGRARLLAAPQVPVSLGWHELGRGALPFLGLTLADTLLQRLDILILSLLGDARLLGLYSAAYNLVRVAVKLIQSLWRALYPTLARLHQTALQEAVTPPSTALSSTALSAAKTPSATTLSDAALRYGMMVCTGGAALVSIVAAEVLLLVYGNADATGAAVLALLVWVAPLFYLELYANTRLVVMGRAGAGLVVILIHLLLLGVFLPILAQQMGPVGAAGAALLAQAAGAVLGMWLLPDKPAQNNSSPWRMLLVGGVVLFLGAAPLPWWFRLLTGVCVYLVGLLISGLLTRRELQQGWTVAHRRLPRI